MRIYLKMTWSNARIECKKNGGDLVSLETSEENYCVNYRLFQNGMISQNTDVIKYCINILCCVCSSLIFLIKYPKESY